MRDLPLNALRAFAAVYSQGGVRAAARELAVTHSSVSRHVAELESWLGVRLVEQRGGRGGLALTAQGEALGHSAVTGLKEIERVMLGLREARTNRTVAITTVPSFAGRWLLPRLPDLEARHPDIDVALSIEQRLEDLNRSGAHFAIRMGNGSWRDLHSEPLMDDELYPVMSPAYWRKAGRPASPARLKGLRLLHDRDPEASWTHWRDAFGPKSLDVRSGPRLASSDLLLRAAAQGQGVVLARHRLAAEDIAQGTLYRPFGELAVRLPSAYWIVRDPRRNLSRADLTVIEWLHTQARA